MRSIWGNRIMVENPDRRSAKRVLNQTGGYGKIWCGGVHVLYETLSSLLFPYNLCLDAPFLETLPKNKGITHIISI